MRLLILFFALIFTLQGCDIFSTRPPEEPDAGGAVYKSKVSPENVVDNLKNSIERKNSEVYISCFFNEDVIDKYEFYPSSDALALYPGVFDNWSIDEEKRFINSLVAPFQPDESPKLEWLNFEFKQYPPDSTLFFADYELKIPIIDQVDDYQMYRGKLQFTIVVGQNGEWSIKRWYDFTANMGTGNSSWSILKADYFY